MKPLTQEWIDKAEGDWATANREYRARKNPNYDAVCFHCQQTAEKYLKAKLQEAGINFRKTHDLNNLLNDVLPLEPTWNNLQNSLTTLTAYGVEYRYPGVKAAKSEALTAVKHSRLLRKTVRQSFNLPA